MSKSRWLIGVALAMLLVAPAMSQQPARDPSQADARILREQATGGLGAQQVGPIITSGQAGGFLDPHSIALMGLPAPSNYWLGVQCSPVPPALRSHLTLPEKQGLLVLLVSKDSPAAKAGVAPYDILLRVGDTSLAEPRDLVTAVEKAKETKLKLELIRGGKPKTIELAPAKRPAQTPGGPVQVPDQADWNTVEKWLEGMASGQEGGGAQPPVQFRIFGAPGAIVPKGMFAPKPLPTNMNIAGTKEGDQPAKITVHRGNDKWELTEKDLDKLPADIRPYVEQMLGHGLAGSMSGGNVFYSPGGMLPMPAPSTGATPGNMQPATLPGGVDPQLQKRFDEMNRRMDQLLKMMEEFNQGRAQPAPENQEK